MPSDAPPRKQSAPTIPAPKDSEIEAFEESIKHAGEWRARLKNLQKLLERNHDEQ